MYVILRLVRRAVNHEIARPTLIDHRGDSVAAFGETLSHLLFGGQSFLLGTGLRPGSWLYYPVGFLDRDHAAGIQTR